MKFGSGGSITESETTNCLEVDAKGLYLEILAGELLFTNANRQSQLNRKSKTLSGANIGDLLTGSGSGIEVNEALDNSGDPTGIYEVTIGTPVGGRQYGAERHYNSINYTYPIWGQ
jgi:hypothetical protein